jgi:hypothetical protein
MPSVFLSEAEVAVVEEITKDAQAVVVVLAVA